MPHIYLWSYTYIMAKRRKISELNEKVNWMDTEQVNRTISSSHMIINICSWSSTTGEWRVTTTTTTTMRSRTITTEVSQSVTSISVIIIIKFNYRLIFENDLESVIMRQHHLHQRFCSIAAEFISRKDDWLNRDCLRFIICFSRGRWRWLHQSLLEEAWQGKEMLLS